MFIIFWSVPKGQSFYIQLTYNSFIIKTIKSEKTKKKNQKIESQVDNQSESFYLPVSMQLPNSQWDIKNTWNSNNTNHRAWAPEINTPVWIEWVFNFVNYDVL